MTAILIWYNCGNGFLKIVGLLRISYVVEKPSLHSSSSFNLKKEQSYTLEVQTPLLNFRCYENALHLNTEYLLHIFYFLNTEHPNESL